MPRVDLNCDLGESFGAYQIGQDDALLNLVTSANIACGMHASDPNVMARTVKSCVERGVAIGAHPGLPDLVGFGRREMQIAPQEIANLMIYQIGALAGFAATHNQKLQHVKPHGALYHMAERDVKIAEAIAMAVRDVDQDLILVCLSGGQLARVGEKWGVSVAHEVFADRTYQPDGTLMPRSQSNALIHDPQVAVDRMARLISNGMITTEGGTELKLRADTICIHGDAPDALEMAQKLHDGLIAMEVELRALAKDRIAPSAPNSGGNQKDLLSPLLLELGEGAG